MQDWVVIKFGGTSVSSAARWLRIETIARAHLERGHSVMIVVSALAGVTNALQTLIDARSDSEVCAAGAVELIALHRRLAAELGCGDDEELDARLADLDQLLSDACREDADWAWRAELLAMGELLSSTLGAAWLKTRGLDAQWQDARELLTARPLPHQSERGRWLSAACQPELDPERAYTLAAQAALHITQGFIVGHPDGGTCLLGRGGSDTSASCLGVLLGARRVEIWTDVPGMFSANPHRVPEARLLRRLDYQEAQEIATTGAKVLHPRSIDPCRAARVPMWIGHTERPELPGTEITHTGVDGQHSIKALSYRAGITLISMESVGMWQQVGFLADVFALFRQHGLSVDLIGSAETNVTVSLDPTENLLDAQTVEALCQDLARVCRVKVIAPCAAITLVGRGMRALLHRLGSVLAEFGQQDVHLISQSSNNLNLTFVVDEAIADSLVPRLHEYLIHAGVLAAGDAEIFGPSWRELSSGNPSAPSPWWQRRRDALLALAAEQGPAYVYDLDVVRQTAQRLQRLAAVQSWFYAMKANACAPLLRALVAEGIGLECVSSGELAHAFASVPSLDPQRVLFTPNFAARAEYVDAIERGVNVTVDNLFPLQHWPEVFAGRDLMLRLDLGSGSGHHEKVRTGGSRSKFGLGLADLTVCRQLCAEHGIRIVGLHAHLGSGILDADHWSGVFQQLASLAEDIGTVRVLDLGGGLGVPSSPGEQALDLTALQAGLAELASLYPQFALWMEPGRYLVAEAGVLLARVNQTKRKTGVQFLGLETGMNSLLRPALYDAWHPVVALSRIDEPATELVQVVGPICETGDLLAADRRLPPCQQGDVMLIGCAGAYGAVMASHYNRREPAREFVVEGDAASAPRAAADAGELP